ncbi:MAG: HlyC/CorC family transporter [Cyclobacteriaceae bacterium]|nr:HlyC/CorC family transporter [Cyclobacteriaceae bacterium]
MALLLFYLFLALIISFLCSIMEAVLLSVPISYLKVREEKGSRRARTLIRLKQNIDKPLSAILSLNTIAHTVGAAGVGAQATKIFGEAYFGLVSAILTLLILVFTEIIPKTIGARFWRRLVAFTGKAVQVTMLITFPLVILSNFITRFLSSKKAETTTSREEFSTLARIGREEGIFEEKENKIIQNLIRLKNIRINEIMTPRVVVSIVDDQMNLKKFPENKELLHFSRIPVYTENAENITGYVLRQSVFEKLAQGENELKIRDVKRDIVIVHEKLPVFNVWERLLEKKEHIALIIDEYGGMEGIVTMEDIIETLLGFEIMDEKDIITDMRQFARQKWENRKKKYNFMDKYTKAGEKKIK